MIDVDTLPELLTAAQVAELFGWTRMQARHLSVDRARHFLKKLEKISPECIVKSIFGGRRRLVWREFARSHYDFWNAVNGNVFIANMVNEHLEEE